MKSRVMLLLLSMCGLALFAGQKEIIGYYPSWQWYDRGHLVNPQTLPYGRLTIINYAFFAPNADGVLAGTDSWADDNILLGENDWVNGGYKPNTSLPDCAHANGVRVLLSLGGWTLSNNFPSIAQDASKRAVLAHSCISQIQKYKFDGIDIDWEYPGFAEHAGTPQDRGNFTLLVREIRDSLDVLEKATQKHYLLTAALPADPKKAENIEVQGIAGILNYLNIMTYDFFGAWDSISNHNSPLYAPTQGNPAFNLDAAFGLYNKQYGVPDSQLNLGVAFYGRSYKNCAALFSQHGGSAQELFAPEGVPLYYEILENSAQCTRWWDTMAAVPYRIYGQNNALLSYDDEESVALKVDYVLGNNARGLIIWEITGDYLPDRSTPLLEVVASKLKGGTARAHPAVVASGRRGVFLYQNNPNPFTVITAIAYYLPARSSVVLDLFDASGKDIDSRSLGEKNAGEHQTFIDRKCLKTGVYFYRINADGFSSTRTMIVCSR